MSTTLRERLVAVPDARAPVMPVVAEAIARSERYLDSPAALRSLELDSYWPKWDSPWWHMLLLFELEEARRIPERTALAMVAALDAMPLKIFPTRPEDVPAGLDRSRHSSCHCALGSIAQVLGACDVDVDRALPWIRPWFVRYQMADGGMTCDNDAYAATDECPSSMVGTIASFEAMLSRSEPATWSREDAAFVARAADFLVGRKLTLGSSTRLNAEEREREPLWRRLCFPRFYFYDVLRGLTALATWMERCNGTVPASAIEDVVLHLCATFPDGIVSPGRLSYAGVGTRALGPDGAWHRQEASTFALLDATSAIGVPSPSLTRKWSETRASLLRSIEAGRVRTD